MAGTKPKKPEPAEQETRKGDDLPTCFIIMPITTPDDAVGRYGGDVDHFKHVLDCLFVPAIRAAGLNPIPPSAEGADFIHARIAGHLDAADLVLCDMSGLNPNVFFELGIRVALNKPMCVVADDVTSSMPFDTGPINRLKYDASVIRHAWLLEEERRRLTDHIGVSLTNSNGKNSVWERLGVEAGAYLRASEHPGDISAAILAELLAVRRELAAQTRLKSSPARTWLTRHEHSTIGVSSGPRPRPKTLLPPLKREDLIPIFTEFADDEVIELDIVFRDVARALARYDGEALAESCAAISGALRALDSPKSATKILRGIRAALSDLDPPPVEADAHLALACAELVGLSNFPPAVREMLLKHVATTVPEARGPSKEDE